MKKLALLAVVLYGCLFVDAMRQQPAAQPRASSMADVRHLGAGLWYTGRLGNVDRHVIVRPESISLITLTETESGEYEAVAYIGSATQRFHYRSLEEATTNLESTLKRLDQK